MKNIIFLNGKFVPRNKAKLSVFDPGFLYALGAFETMRAYGGKIFALERHLKRMVNSLKILNIDFTFSEEKFKKSLAAVLSKNNLKDARIRLTIWQGEDGVNSLIFASKFNGYGKKAFKAVTTDYRVNENSGFCAAKSINYAQFYLARRLAEKKGFDEAIFLNTQGFLAEGSRSNIFLVKNGKIFTPSLKCGCLPGITREIIIELARKIKIPVKEKEIRLKELFQADEVFLTSSLMEVMPLTKVSNSLINKGKIGRITGLLQREYSLAV